MAVPLRVLVVEDDVATSAAIVRSLQSGQEPLEVEECGDGREALGRLAEPFDCVFLDYVLPGLDGLSILRQARAAGVTTPIILLTGMGNEALAVEAMRAGAADYLPKSRLTPETLLQSLRHAIRLHEAERREADAQGRLRQSEDWVFP